MDSKQLSENLKDVISDKKGEDVIVYDVKLTSPIADYYILCSGANERHTNALKDAVLEFLHKNKLKVHHIEGKPETGWILVDGFDVIVNIFTKEERERINLEQILK